LNARKSVNERRRQLNWEVILIESDTLGSPDSKLGAILMSNYLRLLGERDYLPKYIVLLNGAVRLAVKGSGVLEHLKKLEERGVEIVVGKIDGKKSILGILESQQVLTV
jgi:hypothetical protein